MNQRPFDLTFKRFSATPINKENAKVLIRWEMFPSKVSLSDFEFFIDSGKAPDQIAGKQDVDIDGVLQRGAAGPSTESFPMQRINQTPISALDFYEYVDYTPSLKSLHAEIYYRIRCRRISTGEEIQTLPFTWKSMLDLVGLYVVDEQEFLLKDCIGQPCLIHVRRRSGVQCTKCFDFVQKKRLISNCKTCYGTNWEGGFYPPLSSYAGVPTASKETSIQEWGESQPGNTSLQFTNYPILHNGDLVRTIVENRLWRVAQVKEFEKRVTPMIQFAQLVEVNPGDVEYSIPLDEELVRKLLREFEDIQNKREF